MARSVGAPMAPVLATIACLCTGAFAVPAPAQAGPVVCITSLEAPPAAPSAAGQPVGGPVEVTRCGQVTTVPQVMERALYSWSAPYAPGVDVLHQVTDALGIAMGGVNGTKVMGFGFPDQTATWDATAVGNAYQVLLEQQSAPMPWRTADVSNGFCSGLPQGSCNSPLPVAAPPSYAIPVRGLW